MDDDYVTDGWGEKSRSAYMLFYERVEPMKIQPAIHTIS